MSNRPYRRNLRPPCICALSLSKGAEHAACMPCTAWASWIRLRVITRSGAASQIGHDLAHQLGSLTGCLSDFDAGGLQRLLLGGGGSR